MTFDNNGTQYRVLLDTNENLFIVSGLTAGQEATGATIEEALQKFESIL
ncbi:hypothetical protein [Latilactobacillus fuchuensis]|uniref:Uncharacterized protein n=1 Tax=Latilactobacillus fuchuensis TaxID=164393 RepID=A0A2N9DUI2_9LACO|nr:hypothetical protein [Latilactobacillus fuchuensis]MCP8857860.1 hypothetical protein [Latilactobacillus fuchuensis]SPC37732.1 conserved hypothetical protein [Latilactobacillus fuchuensis]